MDPRQKSERRKINEGISQELGEERRGRIELSFSSVSIGGA